MNTRRGQMWCWKATLSAIGVTGVLAASAALLELRSGDEVWVDLNPPDQKPLATAEGSPASGSLR